MTTFALLVLCLGGKAHFEETSMFAAKIFTAILCDAFDIGVTYYLFRRRD